VKTGYLKGLRGVECEIFKFNRAHDDITTDKVVNAIINLNKLVFEIILILMIC
jgi:hypothetical protein